ncbi:MULTISPECIES: SLC13 family permease [Thermomonas]|jgi:di/tricarboxylate transporter|uniref:SLC13 family permease n=1 Tax=Thermomonas beijingensis TaxID=2872701 RepID=A0ABS7TEP0_9GAMM|nr:MULTISPECIES: SLC13 family permease [Thermomonas]MBS0459787.1 SLC13 family permease [Pseudomonadota bacterium]MBZ4186295.1 SLC13 family permease [Thermomonas beijingensis]HOC10243.1 SLC13 family permease [Thermomonas sp.]HQA00974.1 SLC13 family permease [Thermomonas sp.]HQE07292.1 SLC13 family permease [Thermomonas sp.]
MHLDPHLWPQLAFGLILAGGLYLFISEKLRVDVTAMLILLALVVTGVLDSRQALSGFSSEPAIIVAAVFVISGALGATGISERLGSWMERASGNAEWRTIAVVMPLVALLASFTHHVMVTAMMLPLLLRHARNRQLPASRLLMPMSLAASLGTTLTLFSAPAFLLANDMLQRAGAEGLGIFSITPIGLALVLVGTAYMLLTRWLLPKRSGEQNDDDYLRLDRYRTELVIVKEGHWCTRPLTELQKALGERFRQLGWLRDGQRRDDLGNNSPLLAGDVLLVEAAADELMSLHDDAGLDLNAITRFGKLATGEGKAQLVQAVVAPGSEFIGRSIRELDFARQFHTVIAGLWRRGEDMADRLSDARLREGDLLVLWGMPSRFAELAAHHGFLMLVPFAGQAKRRLRAPLALGILGLTVLAAATEWLSPPLAFLFGAVAMVATRCIDVEQAYRSIDLRIYVMIAGVIPLGIAMENTGTAALLAQGLSHWIAHWPPLAILLVMFSIAALLTQVMSDAATTALLGPISIATAQVLGLPPAPFVMCTALGAVVAFLTPIGHHGNLLILRPGQYSFADFLRVGLPLTVLIGLVSAWMARWLWMGGPLLPHIG